MSNYENNKNGTQLCISPLMLGIENDIKACMDIIEHAEQVNLSEDDLYQTAVYLSHLLSTKTKLIALDNSSDGMVDVFRKCKAAWCIEEDNSNE